MRIGCRRSGAVRKVAGSSVFATQAASLCVLGPAGSKASFTGVGALRASPSFVTSTVRNRALLSAERLSASGRC